MIKNRHQYIASFMIIACHSIFGMEHPQLQPKIQKKQLVTHVNCSIMIPENITQLVAYGMQTVHDAIFEHSHLQSNPKNPIIYLCVRMHDKNGPTDKTFYAPLPAKRFFNHTNEVIHLRETDGSKLFKSHPVFKKTWLEITATCTKNPNLKGNSFAEQFNNAMNKFYEDPGSPWIDAKHELELDTAGIITSTIFQIPQIVLSPSGPLLVCAQYITFDHGPNGCPDEKTFIQSIIDEKIVPLRSPLILTASEKEAPITYKSCFRSLRNRELTGSFGKNI